MVASFLILAFSLGALIYWSGMCVRIFADSLKTPPTGGAKT